MTYPILEYDPSCEALIEPSKVIRPRDLPEHCVICFFKDVIDQAGTGKAYCFADNVKKNVAP